MEYAPDLIARLYTLVHRGTPGDVAHYVSRARGRRAVLELGAGAGRVLRAVAPQVDKAVGIERWEGMVAEAAGLPDNTHIVLSDACDFSLESAFDTVFIPYNALFALGGPERIVQALRCARTHAEPGALLVFDCYVLDDEEDAVLLPVEEEQIASIIDRGRRIDVYEWEEPLPGPRAFQMVYRFDIADAEGHQFSVEDRISHHWLPPDALEPLLAAAGWRLERVEAAFENRPLEEDDCHMVVSAIAVG